MPVKGFSEVKRMPRLGVIRIGIKETTATGKEYPKAVDYFVVPPEVQEVYGEKPTSLPVFLPSQEVEENLPVFLKRYGQSKGLICKGDGETATEVDQETGELREIACGYKQCPYYLKKHCKEIGVLSFIMPEVPGFGVWQIATRSYNSIQNLSGSMLLTKKLCGRLAGLPFALTVEAEEKIVPKVGRKSIYVMHLRTDLALAQMKKQPEFEPISVLALPSHDDMLPDDLYPETEEQAEQEGTIDGELVKEGTQPYAPEPTPPAKPVDDNFCAVCGADVPKAVKVYSQHNYGATFCKEHYPAKSGG